MFCLFIPKFSTNESFFNTFAIFNIRIRIQIRLRQNSTDCCIFDRRFFFVEAYIASLEWHLFDLKPPWYSSVFVVSLFICHLQHWIWDIEGYVYSPYKNNYWHASRILIYLLSKIRLLTYRKFAILNQACKNGKLTGNAPWFSTLYRFLFFSLNCCCCCDQIFGDNL